MLFCVFYFIYLFIFFFQVWILETYPNATNWWVKDDSVIPRALSWEDGPKFENNDYDLLFGNNYRVRLLPTGENFTLILYDFFVF